MQKAPRTVRRPEELIFLAELRYTTTFRAFYPKSDESLILQYFNKCVLFFVESSEPVFLEKLRCTGDTQHLISPAFLRKPQARFYQFCCNSFALKTLCHCKTSYLCQSFGINLQCATADYFAVFNYDKEFAGLRQMILHKLVRIFPD